jgi:hypothetical protein
MSETPDTPSTEALTPDEERALRVALEHGEAWPRTTAYSLLPVLLATLDVERAVRQEAADPSGLPRALHMAWTQSGGDYYYGDMFWEKVVARITDVEAALAAGATERPLPEVADTIGHGPCDYNGGPGSDQCPHGVFAPQGDDDA